MSTPWETRVERARERNPGVRFEFDIASRGLRERLGDAPFDVVVSTEVVEHLYDPDDWAGACFEALSLALMTPSL